MVRKASRNPNWKGGVCSIEHVDELLDMPEYLSDRKQFIEDNHTVVGECWNWTRSCFTSNGRARISVGVKSQLAARVSYVAFKLEPIGDLLVCHSCDNVLCVNPDHLWLGTNADNSKDMANKGRTKDQDGELNAAAKLTNESVLRIRHLIKCGITQREIAKIYGVSNGTINLIHKRKIWRHI